LRRQRRRGHHERRLGGHHADGHGDDHDPEHDVDVHDDPDHLDDDLHDDHHVDHQHDEHDEHDEHHEHDEHDGDRLVHTDVRVRVHERRRRTVLWRGADGLRRASQLRVHSLLVSHAVRGELLRARGDLGAVRQLHQAILRFCVHDLPRQLTLGRSAHELSTSAS
jgi:hypothetical protein